MRGVLAISMLLAALPARGEQAAELATVRLTHEAPLERGRLTPLSLGVVLGPGLSLLDDGPLMLELDGVGLSLARRVLYRRDAVDPRAALPRFEVEVRVDRAGTPTLSARLVAWVCRARRCRPVEVVTPLSLNFAERNAP
jgi:hypothetical protein